MSRERIRSVVLARSGLLVFITSSASVALLVGAAKLAGVGNPWWPVAALGGFVMIGLGMVAGWSFVDEGRSGE